MKNTVAFLSVAVALLLNAGDAFALSKKSSSSKQSAIQTGTKVNTKMEATGLYDLECYDSYYSCMDQFCITDNESGGSCGCSDLSIQYEKELAYVKAQMEEAERIATVEVEKVKAGANADIVFGGERRYDEYGNILDVGELTEEEKKKQQLESWFSFDLEDEDDMEDDLDLSVLKGAQLYSAADEMCLEQVPDSCADDIKLLQQMYSRRIISDCKGFENSLASKKADAKLALAKAEADVRNALTESLKSSNKYDLGQCMLEFRKCMQTEDVCGSDWGKCVSVVADAKMQNMTEDDFFDSSKINKATKKAQSEDAYGIAISTLDVLDSKRLICENVLASCVDVRDMVWPAFLREAAPTIKVAEMSAESKMRQSCLTDISSCIQKACKDDIEGKGIATMDACLARPDMARSFCKVEVERCEKMEPKIWAYVTDKLKAMRVDACTTEVKECFTAETRCGKDFKNCIGMDYEFIHDMCPIDTLVVCKGENKSFSMDDLDNMLMGLYLNVDNALLEECQDIVDQRMAELCGSTSDCNRFAADETIGTGSLRAQKNAGKYIISGMISFGSIEMGKAGTDKAGIINVENYINTLKKNFGTNEDERVIRIIEEELNNIAGTINRAIEMIETDPKVQYCVSGRSLNQITGNDVETEARFPRMLDQYKVQIAVSALKQAQLNYNKKLTEEIAKGTKDASADIAQFMCQRIADVGSIAAGTSVGISPVAELAEPMAIRYEISAGLKTEDLAKGGAGQTQMGGISVSAKRFDFKGGGMNKEVTSVFNRENRTCHVCTTIHTETCNVTKKGLLSRKVDTNCTSDTKGPTCEDLPM